MMIILSWIASCLFLGTSFITASYVSHYSMPLEFMMFYRLMAASIILVFIIFIKKQRLFLYRKEIFVSILVASSQLNVWLSAYGTKYMISGLVSCVCLTQIFTAELLSSIVKRHKMRINIIVSGVIGMIGITMLCNQQLFGAEKLEIKNTIIGIIFTFISTFAAAAGNMLYEKKGEIINKMPRTTFLLYNCFFASILLLIIGLIMHPAKELFNPAIKDIKYVGVLLYLTITASIIFLFAMYYIIEKQGAVKATYMNFILPVLTMIISTFAEGYKWNLTAIIGMIILLYSVWIGIREKRIIQEEKKSFMIKLYHLIIR